VSIARLEQRAARLVIACLLLLSACSSSPSTDDDLPAQYGLAQTVRDRDLAEQAIVLVDFLLPPSERLRLRPTWPQSGLYPALHFEANSESPAFRTEAVPGKFFDDTLVIRNADAIPVFLIDGSGLGQVETAFVPDGEHAIFIDADGLDALFDGFAMSGSLAVQQHNSFDRALVLAVVLLHELGHLHYGDRGSYDTPQRFMPADVGQPSTRIHNPELRADRFASEAIERGWATHEMHSAISGPYGKAMIANNLVRAVAVASNSFDLNLDPQGVLSGVQRPELFNQQGLSHLNLYLRLLVLMQQLDPTRERQAELEWIATPRKIGV